MKIRGSNFYERKERKDGENVLVVDPNLDCHMDYAFCDLFC